MKRADVFRYPDMKKNYFEMCRVVYLFDINTIKTNSVQD